MPLTRSVAAFLIALAATQCGGNNQSPTAPTTPETGLQRLEIEVPATLAPDRTFQPGQQASPALVLAPGASVQLTAKGYLADGTSRDVTGDAVWQFPPWSGVASVTGGLVRANYHGSVTLMVEHGSKDSRVWAQKEIFVMSDGTFALRGTLRDATSGQSISGATVAVVDNPFTTTTSRPDGSYLLPSVPPVADIVAKMPGYRSKVQRVTLANHDARLDFSLDHETPLVLLAGTYRLTLAADPNCTIEGTAFPDAVRVRTYTAVVTQIGNELGVTLSGATFHRYSGAGFTGRVSPGLATFTLIGGYWITGFDGNVVELPSPGTALTIAGRATISTSTLAGTMDGSFSLENLEDPTSWSSTCTSPNHQFRMSR